MATRSKFVGAPTFRVSGRVAEEIEEDGLGEGVELGEDGAALGPQHLRPVQHLRNPPLLRQGRQHKFLSIRVLPVQPRYRAALFSLVSSRPVSRYASHFRSTVVALLSMK